MEDTARLTGRSLTAVFAAVLAAVALLACAGVARGEGSAGDAHVEALIAVAHEAAGRDDHGESIQAALAAIERDPARAPGLALLLGYQLTWADRPAEAIPWFRLHLEAHPKDVEARLGLARAISWTDDLDGAHALYTEIAREEPANVDAQLGIARMHEWAGRDGAAAAEYQRARKIDLSSREAVLGLARTENRRGFHRFVEGLLVEYEEREGPSDETRLELARARWWMGEADGGLSTLSGSDGDAASALRAAIRHDRRWRLGAFATHWIDVDDQETMTQGAHAERELAGGWSIYAEIARSVVDEPGIQEITAARFVGGGSWRANRSFAANLRVTLDHVGSGLGDVDSLDAGAGEIRTGEDVKGSRLHWDSWFTWTPRDLTRVDFGYGRVPVETPRARVRDIRVDVLSVGVERRLHDRLQARVHVARGGFSDGNVRGSAEVEGNAGPFAIGPRVETHAGAGALVYGFRDTPDHGYYSPNKYNAVFLQGRVEIELVGDLRLAGEARLASEREETFDRFGVASGGAELRWAPPGLVTMTLFARKSTSRFDTSAGYGTRGIGLSVSIAP